MGGQGLNLGIQDAFNLGWKLAGWADLPWAGSAGGAPAVVGTDGLRGREPVPDRERHRDRSPLRRRWRASAGRPAAAGHRAEAGAALLA